MTSVGVIDLGSVSTRLLITDGTGRGQRHQAVTRLGQGLVDGGRFDPAALERVRQVLVGYRRHLDDAGVGQVDVVATAAARRAGDADALDELVRSTVGAGVRILSGEEEGRLTFAGAVADLDADGPVLVLDIGGGSTEFSIGTTAEGLREVWSAEVGSGTVTDTYLASDPPTPWELAAALSVVEVHVDDVVRELELLGEVLRDGVVVGVGGTITTVAAVELGLVTYDADRIHQLRLGKDAVEDVFRTLATERSVDRAFNPGLPAERVEVIVGGCCVLVEVLRRLGIDEIVVSERDLLDGVAAQRLSR